MVSVNFHLHQILKVISESLCLKKYTFPCSAHRLYHSPSYPPKISSVAVPLDHVTFVTFCSQDFWWFHAWSSRQVFPAKELSGASGWIYLDDNVRAIHRCRQVFQTKARRLTYIYLYLRGSRSCLIAWYSSQSEAPQAPTPCVVARGCFTCISSALNPLPQFFSVSPFFMSPLKLVGCVWIPPR